MNGELASAIVTYAIIPILIIVIGAIGVVIKHYADKISKSIILKNVTAEMEKKTSARIELMTLIEKNVQSAVASNMQLANQMKRSGEKLTVEEIRVLNDSAKQLVMTSLPPELTNSDGVLCEMIGGPEKLETIINAMMEKAVYEFKIKKMQAEGLVPNDTEISPALTPTLQEIIDTPNNTKVSTPTPPKKKHRKSIKSVHTVHRNDIPIDSDNARG